jgi:Ca2+-binding RTX toxin-like protein
VIGGTAEAGSLVALRDGTTLLGSATAQAGSGAWSMTVAGLSEGGHSLTVTATDLAGNTSAATPFLLALDQTAPQTTLGPVAAPNGTPSVVLSGTTSEAGSVLLTVTGPGGAVPVITVPVDGGAWSHTLATPSLGAWSVSAVARDVAGNSGANPAVTNFTILPVNTPPVVTSSGAMSFSENETGVAYQAVGSDPENTPLTWSLGGTDAARFDINAANGAVIFKTLPDFEAPQDDGGNNVYDITVTASDGILSSAVQAVAISVTNVAGPAQTGTAGPDALTVGGENARLTGLGGNDTLTGGAGRDTLEGDDGNDVYFMSDSFDLIIETAGGGADTIITSVSMTTPDHVEALQIEFGISGITITGGSGNDMLIGNGLANAFVGGAGDDVILIGNATLADIYALFAT